MMILRVGDHVVGGVALRNDLLGIREFFQSGDPVAQKRRFLEIERLGRFLHFSGEALLKRGVAVFQKFHGVLHRFPVFLLRDAAAAGRAALLDEIIEAGSSLSDLLRKTAGAVRQKEDLLRRIDRLVHGEAAHIRPDVGCVVVVFLERGEDPRPGLVCDFDIAVAFVVAQKDVVFRHILLDQAAFEDERLEFAVGHDIFEMIDVFDHLAHLFAVAAVGAEILADAVFERLRLSDIDDFAAGIVHDIDAGRKRQLHCFLPQGFFQGIVCHRRMPPFAQIAENKKGHRAPVPLLPCF